MKEFIPEGTKGTIITSNWSVVYDGHSLMELLKDKPKMSYSEIRTVIFNEGGYIDDKCIIHMGSAKNKVVTID